jgi:hypothetical protein
LALTLAAEIGGRQRLLVLMLLLLTWWLLLLTTAVSGLLGPLERRWLLLLAAKVARRLSAGWGSGSDHGLKGRDAGGQVAGPGFDWSNVDDPRLLTLGIVDGQRAATFDKCAATVSGAAWQQVVDRRKKPFGGEQVLDCAAVNLVGQQTRVQGVATGGLGREERAREGGDTRAERVLRAALHRLRQAPIVGA